MPGTGDKGTGYPKGKSKGKGKGKNKGGKGPIVCHDCGQPGHWRGDPQCIYANPPDPEEDPNWERYNWEQEAPSEYNVPWVKIGRAHV